MKKRIEWLDILKGFLIITVMMGHTEGIPIGLKTWIYSFHMPLFFFLSGFTLSVDKYDFKTFLQKKLKTLLLPGITFMIIIGAYSILVLKVKLTVQNFFLGVIMQMRGQDITIAWFLVCLFLSEITLYIIIKFLKDNNKNVSILLMVISMLNFIYIKFISKSLSNTILPYSIDVIGIVIPFIYLGYLTKKEEYFEFKNYNVLIGISSMVLGVILCTINYKIFRYHVDIYSDMIGSYSLFYGSAILGIIGLITLFKYLKKLKILKYVGENSLIYYVFHTTFFSTYDLILNYYGISSNKIIMSIVYVALTLILVIPIIYIVNKYFPYILGKKKNLIQKNELLSEKS